MEVIERDGRIFLGEENEGGDLFQRIIVDLHGGVDQIGVVGVVVIHFRRLVTPVERLSIGWISAGFGRACLRVGSC
jgi:hypothetical protein